MQKKTNQVKTLMDAMPFIKEYNKEIVVIKYGGSAQTSPQLKHNFVKDIALLNLVGIKTVIVHGGGAKINELLNDLNIKNEFIDGHRVTSKETMRVVEMVLSGEINNDITSLLNYNGIKAIGISGKDSQCIQAKPKADGKWGYTGEITHIDSKVIQKLIYENFVPVIAPIADSKHPGHPGYNINADIVASEIAIALKAKKILFLTDIAGVLDDNKKLISSLTPQKTEELISSGVIAGGMIPKVHSCTHAVNGGVLKAHIIDGRVEHSILLELFTSDGIGTQFSSKKDK